jgi:hypothetical protein
MESSCSTENKIQRAEGIGLNGQWLELEYLASASIRNDTADFSTVFRIWTTEMALVGKWEIFHIVRRPQGTA